MSNSIYSGDSREEGDLDSDGAETPEVCATPRPGGMQREPPGPRSILVTHVSHVTSWPADARRLNEKMKPKPEDKKTFTKTKSDSLTKRFNPENNAPSKTKKGEPPKAAGPDLPPGPFQEPWAEARKKSNSRNPLRNCLKRKRPK